MSQYPLTREEIARKNRLAHKLDEIEDGLRRIDIELCALLPHPKNPNWMLALGNKNPADAECLQKALNTVQYLIELFDNEEQEC